MWDRVQKEGQYKLFVMDIKTAENKVFLSLANLFYIDLFKIKDLEKNILLENLQASEVLIKETGETYWSRFFMGDLLDSVLRDSISDDEVYQIIKEKKELGPINFIIKRVL